MKEQLSLLFLCEEEWRGAVWGFRFHQKPLTKGIRETRQTRPKKVKQDQNLKQNEPQSACAEPTQGVNQCLKDVTQTQQRPGSPTLSPGTRVSTRYVKFTRATRSKSTEKINKQDAIKTESKEDEDACPAKHLIIRR